MSAEQAIEDCPSDMELDDDQFTIDQFPAEILERIVGYHPAWSLVCVRMYSAYLNAYAADIAKWNAWRVQMGTSTMDPRRTRWALTWIAENIDGFSTYQVAHDLFLYAYRLALTMSGAAIWRSIDEPISDKLAYEFSRTRIFIADSFGLSGQVNLGGDIHADFSAIRGLVALAKPIYYVRDSRRRDSWEMFPVDKVQISDGARPCIKLIDTSNKYNVPLESSELRRKKKYMPGRHAMVNPETRATQELLYRIGSAIEERGYKDGRESVKPSPKGYYTRTTKQPDIGPMLDAMHVTLLECDLGPHPTRLAPIRGCTRIDDRYTNE